jgi:nucleoside recognition membrane protein YjiH
MIPFESEQLLVLFVIGLIGLGVISILGGIFVLVRKSFSKEVHVIADQVTKLAKAGVNNEMSGLVGNASSLIDSLNQLTKTATGIGIFLVLIGCLLFVGAGYLIFQF